MNKNFVDGSLQNNTHDNSVQSLDMDIECNRLYYKAQGDLRIYSILHSAKSLCCLFSNIIDMYNSDFYNCDGKTESTAIELKLITSNNHSDELKTAPIVINTPNLIETISGYITIWEKKVLDEDYIKEAPTQTHFPEHILVNEDLSLLNKYIDNQMLTLSSDELDRVDKDPLYKKYKIIILLQPLLVNVDGYLQMEGFSKKIYAYIATLIWKCSLLEISHISNDPYFENMQNYAINNWNEQKTGSSLQTTGDGYGIDFIQSNKDNNV